VRREQVEPRRAAFERLFDERVQRWVREARDDLDGEAGLALELWKRVVERVVHRPADERYPHDVPEICHACYPTHPPSIIKADPVTNAASSLAR
jgi:hypothetical protein